MPSILLELDTFDSTSKSSDFGSSDFANKANMKTLAVLHVLQSGYNPLLSDVDIQLFKNPFPFFTCSECDLHIQREEGAESAREKNSGFMSALADRFICSYVRNSEMSLSMFQRAWQLYQENRSMRHQVAISTSIDEFLLKGLKMYLLSIREFAPGWMFFEEMHYLTLDDLPCDDCVMFHNNWVMTASAKVYRMKELGLYRTSSDYYTNQESLYMTYTPLPEEATIRVFLVCVSLVVQEQEMLSTMLLVAVALNRILILPSFHCHRADLKASRELQFDGILYHPANRCTLNTFWCVRDFDREFGDWYRESISF